MKVAIDAKGRLRLRLAGHLARADVALAVRCMGVLAVCSGRPVAVVARACRVSRPTVYAWVRAAESGGPEALIGRRVRAGGPRNTVH